MAFARYANQPQVVTFGMARTPDTEHRETFRGILGDIITILEENEELTSEQEATIIEYYNNAVGHLKQIESLEARKDLKDNTVAYLKERPGIASHLHDFLDYPNIEPNTLMEEIILKVAGY